MTRLRISAHVLYTSSQFGGGWTSCAPLGPLICFAGSRRALRVVAALASSGVSGTALRGDRRIVVDSTLTEVAGVTVVRRFRFPSVELSALLVSSAIDAVSDSEALTDPLARPRSDWRVLRRFSGDNAPTTCAVSRDIRDVRILCNQCRCSTEGGHEWLKEASRCSWRMPRRLQATSAKP